MLLHAVYFILSIFLLWFGSDWIVDAASAVARRFNVSELVIGLTIVAMGTSAPEFLVTATAAFRGMSDISLSNVVGSNIFNLGFILGIMALIKPLPTSKTLVFRDGLLLLCVTALILGLTAAGELGRIAGTALLLILVSYVAYLLVYGSRNLVFAEAQEQARVAGWKDYPKLLAGFAAIALGGDLMVDSARFFALSFGVSQWVVGVTVVAAGTSLPELVTCLAASIKGRNEMLLGNLVGSDLFNFAGVLGLTCLLRPLHVAPGAVESLVMLVSMIGLVLVLMRTGWRVGRAEGALLILLTALRWARDFMS
ncbi:MAG: calcium/sodium antiporter [Desulfovibrionaceae bacterium]